MPNKGKGEGGGSGAAAGMGVMPIGFLATRGDQISFIPSTTTTGLSAAFEKLPGLFEKIIDKKKQQKEEVVAA